MEAYFDNSATTRVFDSVKDIVVKTMTEDYGNPSAKHRKGMEAERYVRQAAADIARTLKVRDKEILFTSGGTESNNMALIGTAMANQRAGKHIISTRIEHASVYNPLAYLEQQGFEVTYLSVDSQGHISLEELESAIRQDTILVSIMYVNNEVGAIEPVEQIASLVHGKNPSILSMWTPYRHTASLPYVRRSRESTCCLSAPIRFTAPREWGFSTSTRG